MAANVTDLQMESTGAHSCLRDSGRSPRLGARLLDRQGNAVRVQIQPESRLGRIPAGFMGLGYEVSSVSERGLLTASNHAYVQLLRTLSTSGVIRIGGNTSDYASWSPNGPASFGAQSDGCADRRGIAGSGNLPSRHRLAS
jgi:hypothetical protein